MRDLLSVWSILREVTVDELLVEDSGGGEHDDLADFGGPCQVVNDLGDDH